jgi:sarcosine oxidase delta subunit
MMRTSRFKPAVLYLNTNRDEIPLFVPRNDAINMTPLTGTEFIGADMLRLNHRPSNIDIWRHYVFIPNEFVGGKAPRAYHMDGLREWFRTGHTTNPHTMVPLRKENIKRTNAWQTYH